MALKDWVKISGKDIWKGKSSFDNRLIMLEYVGAFYKNLYRVYAKDKIGFITNRNFKSKSQALKFAKQYMESH